MTSRSPRDGADGSDSAATADSEGRRVGSRGARREDSAEREGETVALRSRLSTLGTVLVALAVLCSVLGAAATGPAAATLGASDAGDTDEAAAAVAAESADAVSREIDGSFSRQTYTGTAGDPVEIRHAVDASEGDTAYLLVGGNRLTDSGGTVGYVDVLKVGDGSTTINTRLLGTNETDVRSCSDDGVSCDLEFKNEDGEVVADSLANLSGVGATGAGGLARPLVPERYRLAITNGTFIVRDSGAVDPVEVAAESDLVLEKPGFGEEAEVFTTADSDVIADGGDDGEGTESLDALRESGLDRTAVTKGDRVVLGFEATGIWGAMSHFAERRSGESGDGTAIEAGTEIDHAVLVDLLEAEEGVSLTVRQTNPGRNEPRTELDLADADADDVSLFLAEGEALERGDADRNGVPGRFYLAIDTSDGGAFTHDVEPGDEFAVEFALEGTEGERYRFDEDGGEPPAAFGAQSAADEDVAEQYPYHGTADGRASAEASFSVRERYLRYDHVTDDGTVLVETGDGTITGTTTILPVAELSATVVRDTNETPSRTESELTIEDGNFSADSGLADVAPGTGASYRLYRGQSLQDSRAVLVVENATDPDRLRLANETTTTNLTVTRGESLGNLTAAVENVGQLRNRERLTLDVDDGAIVEERYVTVAPQTETNETFGEFDADLEPGEYPYSLAIDGDRVNGTLIVEADPAVTRVDESDVNGSESTDWNGSEPTDGNASKSADGGEGSDGGEDGSDDDSDADDSTGNDSTEGGLNEEGSNESQPAGDDGGTPTEEPDEAPATLLPFGIGTRETFGGTALVGATYLLGHWV